MGEKQGKDEEKYMLLAVDVGNTDITFGVFNDMELAARFRCTVKVPRTSDEYGELICNILAQKGYQPSNITKVIIASVVPQMMYSFTSGIIKYLGCQPIVVGAGIKRHKDRYSRPEADRPGPYCGCSRGI